MVLKYFGQLCIALAALTVVPLAVSLLFGEFFVSIRYTIVLAGIGLTGLLCSRLPAPGRMQNNEAMVITALIFLFSPLVMTWPVMASGLQFSDAIFETVSAVTTTGLSATTNLAETTQTFLFARAWMQWTGGLGIVVLCMAALIQPGLTAKRLDIEESFDEDIIGNTRTIARRILLIYSLLTLVGIIVLVILQVPWYTALLYTLTAVSTAGFAPHDASLAGLQNNYGEIAVIIISVSGAVSLLVYHRVFNNGWPAVRRDPQLFTFLLISFFFIVVLTCLLHFQDGFNWTVAFRQGALNGLSALSTTGFSLMDIGEMGDGSKFTLILAMFIGGSAGSTAGGIKIIRLIIIIRLLSLILQWVAAPPQAVTGPRLAGHQLSSEEIINALILFVLFIGVVALSWLPFLAMGHAPLDTLFEIVSAIATTGLSTGITATDLHPLLKGILCVDMLLGRLEIVAWLVFFHPRTWFGLRKGEIT